VAVVCAGAKAILDLRLTLEYLETHGVPVVGYRTDRCRPSTPRAAACRWTPFLLARVADLTGGDSLGQHRTGAGQRAAGGARWRWPTRAQVNRSAA
jgi:pseudouridine-5'-phosphate glycosidase